MKGLHTRDGLYFERLPNGDVEVSYTVPLYGPGEKSSTAYLGVGVIKSVVLPPNEWASAVAHVSHRGETGEAWREASDFHGDPGEEA